MLSGPNSASRAPSLGPMSVAIHSPLRVSCIASRSPTHVSTTVPSSEIWASSPGQV